MNKIVRVGSAGPVHARIMLVGEAPGKRKSCAASPSSASPARSLLGCSTKWASSVRLLPDERLPSPPAGE